MDALAFQFLIACDSSIQYRHPLLDELASSLGVNGKELYYQWVRRRWRRASFAEWQYFFHGAECDLRHTKDGRFLRVDFGPKGIDTAFTAWGVTQFIMTTVSPWREFPQLKSHLAKGEPPYNEHSGSLERAGLLLDKLEQQGLVAVAAPELLALERKYTHQDSEGREIVQYPEEISEEQQLDIHVARRKVITEQGKKMILNRVV